MSYPQAFHTSCRSGLSGNAGFQYNAASAELADDQLARLAAGHSGYRLPPGAPLEPNPMEIATLPVSLRYLPVDGVGPVISRTAYVGREFRGQGDEPDMGRFGNYFSHIVVGSEGGFGDLHPIELWDSPHWSTTESTTTELPPLGILQPGPVDLDSVLERLLPERSGALAAVAGGALRATLGGPRLVIVEADPELAAHWVAWATFALPPDRVAALTFSTFEGRPRTAESVRLCVATPACDLEFAPYELDSSVVVLESTASTPGPVALYGRAAAALAEQGAEAVTTTIRALDPGLDLDAAGAALVASGGSAALVEPPELQAVLATLYRRLGGISMGQVAASAAALPKDESEKVATEWSRLYAAARAGEDDEGAAALADESLGRLLDFLADGGEVTLAPVAPDAPGAPSVALLARWMAIVSAASGTPRLAPLALAGVRLGLVGRNAALDRELVALLACAGIEILERVADDPAIREVMQRVAAESEDFESRAAWELLRTRGNPAACESAVTDLAALATTERHAATIRRLFGEGGPTRPQEHAALLRGWKGAGRTAPAQDQEAALHALSSRTFAEPDVAVPLWDALRDGPAAVRADPEIRAWELRIAMPPKRRAFFEWARDCGDLLDSDTLSPGPSRRRELERLAAQRAVRCIGEKDYEAGIEVLIEALGERWLGELGAALAVALERSAGPEALIARYYVCWQCLRRAHGPLLEVALPEATRGRSAKELASVGDQLDRTGKRDWEEWLDRHPPRRAVSRAIRTVLRRGEEER